MVMGTFCNISSPADVQRLASLVKAQMGHVDLWINCAGYSGSFREFTNTRVETMSEVSVELVFSIETFSMKFQMRMMLNFIFQTASLLLNLYSGCKNQSFGITPLHSQCHQDYERSAPRRAYF